MSKNNLKKLTIATGGLFGLSLVSLGLSYFPRKKKNSPEISFFGSQRRIVAPKKTDAIKRAINKIKYNLIHKHILALKKKYIDDPQKALYYQMHPFTRGAPKYEQLMNIGWESPVTIKEKIDANLELLFRGGQSPFSGPPAQIGKPTTYTFDEFDNIVVDELNGKLNPKLKKKKKVLSMITTLLPIGLVLTAAVVAQVLMGKRLKAKHLREVQMMQGYLNDTRKKEDEYLRLADSYMMQAENLQNVVAALQKHYTGKYDTPVEVLKVEEPISPSFDELLAEVQPKPEIPQPTGPKPIRRKTKALKDADTEKSTQKVAMGKLPKTNTKKDAS